MSKCGRATRGVRRYSLASSWENPMDRGDGEMWGGGWRSARNGGRRSRTKSSRMGPLPPMVDARDETQTGAAEARHHRNRRLVTLTV